jgi:hypothetical protein
MSNIPFPITGKGTFFERDESMSSTEPILIHLNIL